MTSLRRLIRSALVVALAVASIFTVFQLTNAGSLTPSESPGGTMKTSQDIYDPLVGTSYDSSGVTGSLTGSALEVSRCIILRIAGTPCL